MQDRLKWIYDVNKESARIEFEIWELTNDVVFLKSAQLSITRGRRSPVFIHPERLVEK